MKPIYLDYNATTPVDPEVFSVMLPFLTDIYGNPSSSHAYGIESRLAVEKAREQVAKMLECHPDEIFFTSGGTESNNIAIQGVAFANKERGNHIIISAVEHPAVAEVAHYLQKFGFEISIAPVDNDGRVDPLVLESLITPATILISVMHANNEVGTIQPINEIAKIAHLHNIVVHSDAAQSIGKVPVKVKALGIDLLSIAGHKLYAPKGVGALFIKRGVALGKFIHGADHESNMRPGTENVASIVALGKACELVTINLDRYARSMRDTRDHLASGLLQHFSDLKINGHPQYRLPNTLNISFKGTGAGNIIKYLTDIALSAGAACHSSSGGSNTLDEMNMPPEYSFGALRISTGRTTTIQDADKAVHAIVEAVKKSQASDFIVNKTEPVALVVVNRNLFESGAVYYTELETHALTKPVETTRNNNSVLRITQFDSSLGCGCKIKPADLDFILKKLPLAPQQNALVTADTNDDAAVWKINDKEAIVQTIDFFTPMIDDPYSFGAIAAANSLSDIYAMGANPLFALNLVTFPVEQLSLDILREIIKGASDKCLEAGISILGGHSIEDTGIKFGLVVTGIAPPDRIITNAGAKPGDKIILTKSIGTGIITRALSKGLISPDDPCTLECIDSMMTLNKDSAEVMSQFKVSACTDITGFGLTGHMHEMLFASGVNAEIYFDQITFFSEAERFARMGIIPGSTFSNEAYVEEWVDFGQLKPYQRALLCDTQTSGGLLISTPDDIAESLLNSLKAKGINAAIIGNVTTGQQGRIYCKY